MEKVDIFAEHNLVPAEILDFTKLNKAALGLVSGAVIERVEEGTENPLETYIKAKAIQEVAGGIISGLKGLATDEAEKYSKADSNMLGCEFVVKSGSTSYSFDHDDEWNIINDQIKDLMAVRKEREKKMIQAVDFAELTAKGGEVIPPAEVKHNRGSILTINIPKK